jgi:hypothetical protein
MVQVTIIFSPHSFAIKVLLSTLIAKECGENMIVT